MELFGRTVLKETFYQGVPDFHKEIYEVFADPEATKVLIVAPRAHAKSTLAGLVLPLHSVFYGKGSSEGRKNIVLVSRTQKHAIRLLNTIKENLDMNKYIKYFFGDYSQNTAKKWTETEIILKNDTLITAMGTGQQIRGIKHGNTRPTLIILDDPEDEENTRTIDAMNTNLEWLLGAALPSVDDPRISKVVCIGTVIHKYCIVNRIKNMSGWKKLWYKAIQDDGVSVLWNERRPLSWLLQEKESYISIGKASLWYMEYQNEVIAPETQPFKEQYIQYHDYDLKVYKDYKYSELVNRNDPSDVKPVNVYMGIDPASSVEATADFSAICILAMDNNKDIYVIDMFHKRVHPMDLAKIINDYYHKFLPNIVNIETVGYQEMLRDFFRYNKIYIPGLERKNNPRTAKSKRILSFQPHFANKVVFIAKHLPAFVDELIQYNSEKTNNQDDQLDAFYYALKDARPTLRKEPINSINELEKKMRIPKKYFWQAL